MKERADLRESKIKPDPAEKKKKLTAKSQRREEVLQEGEEPPAVGKGREGSYRSQR